MKEYFKKDIKNIVLMGHMGSGKTTLVEALAYVGKSIAKKGEVDKKTSISDYTVEEQTHKFSVSAASVPVYYNDVKLNFIDLPGLNEFVYDQYNCLPIASSAILVLDATKGVEVGTMRAWRAIRKQGIPAFVVVNKMDKENIHFDKILDQIKEKLGNHVLPFMYPLGKADSFEGFANVVDLTARRFQGSEIVDSTIDQDKLDKVNELHSAVVEAVAESSEELLEKFFSGEELTVDEINGGLRQAIAAGDVTPILLASGIKDMGAKVMLDLINNLLPSMDEYRGLKALDASEKEMVVKVDDNAPFAGYVFKTLVDPFIGTISFVFVANGQLAQGQTVFVDDKAATVGPLFTLLGKQQNPVDVAHAGDIVCVSKMPQLYTGASLLEKGLNIRFVKATLPNPTIYKAILPKNKADEDKLSSSLQKLALEDQSFEIVRNKETKQQLIGGQGAIHIDLVLEKMKNMFKVDVNTDKQKIVYRETLKSKAQAEGRYVKQSGGSGYYGVVVMSFEPTEGDSVFTEQIFGGAVPKNYFPAVEKGFFEALEAGPLAGYPVINVKAVLLDGKYHPVDSNELAFKNAAKLAFKESCSKAKLALLEPIMSLKITVSDEYLGDILGDINKRRGRVLGMHQSSDGNFQVVEAEVPEAEIVTYTLDLKAMTQGDGVFSREFLRYEEVPGNVAEKVIAEAKAEAEQN